MNSNKAAVTTTVGFMCLAVTSWLVSMTYTGWYPMNVQYPDAMNLAFALGIVLLVTGVLAFMGGRALDAIIFLTAAGLFWTYHMPGNVNGPEAHSFGGWFFFVWAVFIAWVWLGSFKAGFTRMLYLLGFWLMFLAMAIAAWTGMHGFFVLAGYIGLVTALLAAFISADAVIAIGKRGDPNHAAP